VQVQFLYRIYYPESSEFLTHHAKGHWHVKESNCRVTVRIFLRADFRNLLLLSVSYLIFDLGPPRFVLSPYLHLSFAFLVAQFLGHLAHLLALP
jgi:hypothetical protein